MQLVVTGLISSFKSMGSIVLVMLLVLGIFSVIGVDIFRVCMHACMHHRRRLCHAVFGIIIIIIIGTILLLHGSCSDDGRKMSVRCCVLSLLVTNSTPFYSGHFFSYVYFDRSHAIPDLSCPEVSDYNLLWTDSFHYTIVTSPKIQERVWKQHDLNFAHFGNASLTLLTMATGEGWPKYVWTS